MPNNLTGNKKKQSFENKSFIIHGCPFNFHDLIYVMRKKEKRKWSDEVTYSEDTAG